MKKWYALLAALVLTVGFAACSGGGEEAPTDSGEALEEAVQEMEDATSAVGDAIEEVAEDAAEAADDAVESTEDAVEEMRDEAAETIDNAAAAIDGAVDAVKTELAKLTDQEVEVGCGMCMYSMEGVETCELAAKVDGKPYLVTGVEFDTHGSGLCNATSNATITGSVTEDGITASKVELTD